MPHRAPRGAALEEAVIDALFDARGVLNDDSYLKLHNIVLLSRRLRCIGRPLARDERCLKFETVRILNLALNLLRNMACVQEPA